MPRSKHRDRWYAGGASRFLFAWAALGCGGAPAPRAPDAAPALVETASESSTPHSFSVPGNDVSEPLEPSAGPPGDTSLAIAVYRAAGVPEVDHPWSVSDYERCLEVFVEMLRSGREDLPRHGSARSGPVFARLRDARNFDTADLNAASKATPGERARRLQRYLEVFPGLLKVYSPASDGLDFSVEQAELIVGLLELLKSALEASRRWSAEDARWTPEYERQKQMTLGVVRGSNAMLAEPERYSPALRQRLKAELARRAPDLERHLPSHAAREVHAIAQPDGDARRTDSEPLR